MLPLSILMTKEVKKVDSKTTIYEAAQLMKNYKIGSLLVEQGHECIGIVSETDLVRKGLAESVEPYKTRVDSIMSSPVISIDIKKSAKDANDMMSERGIRHLAVTEHGKIIGMLSVRDLLIYFKNAF
ncbi:MAG: CBS domain-containing protein [Nitrospirae bacterium]|nr:CBS domain-containing protein [Nitrospirota bacterium]MBI3352571.1 CBS domain-containing protein [Nitrospirota bacterium]